MRGLRRVQKSKLPNVRPGLDDPAHKARVRALPCFIQGKRGTMEKWHGVYPNRELMAFEVQHVCSSPSDPHHTTRKSQRGHDRTTVPLCRAAHDLLHQMGEPGFQALWGVDLKAEAKRLAGFATSDETGDDTK